MRIAGLLAALVLAKALVLYGHEVPWSAAALLAYFWQDLAVVTGYAALEFVLGPVWIGWALYALIVVYVVVNVPVARVLSTPLTLPMLRAASGPLADSILYYVTGPNILCFAAVIAVAAVVPISLRSRVGERRARISVALAALPLALLGSIASARIDAGALGRNPITALIATALPRVSQDKSADGDWPSSPFGAMQSEDLTALRGGAHGRNVVIVHLESTAARYLRIYGAHEDPMPNLGALAAAAIVAESAYTVYPETVKSLVAVQSSLYPALDTEAERYEHIAGASLAAQLAQAGYRTGLFHSGRFRYLGMANVVRNAGYGTLEDAGDIGGNHESSFGIDDTSTARRILSWIDAQPRERPFYVSYMPIAGHHPYETPESGPFGGEEPIGRYLNALHYSDEVLGDLVEGLRRRGLFESTLIVILGDHGEAFGQHPANIGHTLFIYDENVRIPFLIVAPGLIRDSIKLSRVVSVVDTAPTILDLLGLPAPTNFQGRSLLDPQQRMALFCTDYSQGLLGLRDGRWKLIHNLDSGRAQLFDLLTDPDEGHDLSDLYPALVEAYRSHLLRWSVHQKHLVSASQRQ
jgi:arylsulfatase A-like enzyme